MFQGYSNFSGGVDMAFAIIVGISLFFLIGITAVIIYFIVKYNKKNNPVASEIEGSNKLEIIWTVIPLILVLFMFWLGWSSYIPMRKVPADAMKIKVTAQMWSWRFEYENGKVEDTLFVPVNKPVVLNMESIDVIHSLYIPAFRIKEDVVPGKKENYMWFKSLVIGSYDLFCAEYCGLRHSYMGTTVEVVDQGTFDKWYASGSVKMDSALAAVPGAAGKLLTEQKGCIACHSADGTKLVGPSYKGIFGHKVTVETNGKEREVTVDDEYLKRSILDANADVVKGFPKGSMPDYKALLNEEEVGKIIEYIKTLSEEKNSPGELLRIISELGKVRISIPVAFTTFTGYILSHGEFDRGFILPFIGIFLLACGASAFNQLQETETDKIMKRTAGRPLPSGRISKTGALVIALVYFISGCMVLYFGPGLLTLLVGVSTFVWYNLIYTPLKKVTAFAAVPGSMVGALPPLAGWVAGGGSLTDPRALALGFFFFMGQIPHFWLLLLKLGKQYESANLPSLTQLLSDEQIKRLTFVWIAATAVSALALPLFKLQDQIWSVILIILMSAALIVIFFPLLNRKKPFNVGKSFVLINVYYLFVMLVMIADKLI